MSIQCALKKAEALSKVVDDMMDVDESMSPIEYDTICENETETLYQAAHILRRDILKVRDKKLKNEYYASKEMNLDAMKDFVSPLLYNLLGWVTDKTLFEGAIDIADEAVDNHIACLTIACDVCSLSTKVMSPKHLGLAIDLHQKSGSRIIIDDLYTMGYTISYTELLHFLTSAAVHIASGQTSTPSGGFIST